MNKFKNIQDILNSIYSLIREAKKLQIENIHTNDSKSKNNLLDINTNNTEKRFGFKKEIKRTPNNKYHSWENIDFSSTRLPIYKSEILSKKSENLIERIFVEEHEKWLKKRPLWIKKLIYEKTKQLLKNKIKGI
tara:strand:- start:189 stop:590 length:402 start_codon:yes stop_codon:yes gene_type:complete